MENVYAGSFHSLRAALFKVELFTSLKEAQVVTADWRQHYDTRSLTLGAGLYYARGLRRLLWKCRAVGQPGGNKNAVSPTLPTAPEQLHKRQRSCSHFNNYDGRFRWEKKPDEPGQTTISPEPKPRADQLRYRFDLFKFG